MSTAFVLMTAMPPTKGHLHLIQFACAVADEVCLMVGTQPGEPYVEERVAALRAATERMPVRVANIHRTLPQRPEDAADFWPMWRGFLRELGMREHGDFIVASDPYGAKLAEITGGEFIPYDVERSIYPTRATAIRENPLRHFDEILPEFQPYLRQRVTILGAESTGKTTLSCDLATALDCHWLPEWARPYLEQTTTPEVDLPKMRAIWRGQRALQRQGRLLLDKPFVIQDTDLFATVGFWKQWQPSTLPRALIADALADRSDLYLLTPANIPFEADPLRYGGDVRETPDSYWLHLAEEHGLNYRVIEAAGREERVAEASVAMRDHFTAAVPIGYQRRGQ